MTTKIHQRLDKEKEYWRVNYTRLQTEHAKTSQMSTTKKWIVSLHHTLTFPYNNIYALTKKHQELTKKKILQPRLWNYCTIHHPIVHQEQTNTSWTISPSMHHIHSGDGTSISQRREKFMQPQQNITNPKWSRTAATH